MDLRVEIIVGRPWFIACTCGVMAPPGFLVDQCHHEVLQDEPLSIKFKH